MPRRKGRLIDSNFNRDNNLPFPQPEEIKAHSNGISILFRREHEEDEDSLWADSVFLSPRHINTIVAMAEDWDESHWDALHEKQA